MFFKYASNILNDIHDRCLLKSFATKNEDDAVLYRKIAHNIKLCANMISVEEKLIPKSSE